jgi:hypothetical protein
MLLKATEKNLLSQKTREVTNFETNRVSHKCSISLRSNSEDTNRKCFWNLISWKNRLSMSTLNYTGQSNLGEPIWFTNILDRGSVDRISLDRISWSKVSNNLGVWLNYRSTAKIHQFFFGSWSKVLIMVF